MPGIQFRNIIFKATLIPSFVTALLLYIMISLGFWQLDRAEYKANLQSIIESRQNIEAIDLNSIDQTNLLETVDDWLYQPVYTSGIFDHEYQILLDNQVNNMTAGYSVFTPLKLNNSKAILVNRGWIAQGKSRAELPDISLNEINTNRAIKGLVATAPSKGLVLSDMANSYSSWPSVLQYIDINEIETQLGYDLLPMVLIIKNSADSGFQAQEIKINMRSEKHTGYAFQWFALSLALLIIYIVVNSKRLDKD